MRSHKVVGSSKVKGNVVSAKAQLFPNYQNVAKSMANIFSWPSGYIFAAGWLPVQANQYLLKDT